VPVFTSPEVRAKDPLTVVSLQSKAPEGLAIDRLLKLIAPLMFCWAAPENATAVEPEEKIPPLRVKSPLTVS
jgi:hypothetical protein